MARQPDRRLGTEAHVQLGVGQRLEQRRGVVEVGSQVVVEEVEPRPAGHPRRHPRPEPQLLDHPFGLHVALPATVDADDRAELAVEPAAACGLHRVPRLVARERDLLVRVGVRLDPWHDVHALPTAVVHRLQVTGSSVGQDVGEDDVGLAGDDGICVQRRLGRQQRRMDATDDDRNVG